MGRTDSAARVIPASPDRVYAAMVDPEALAAWLPPSGMAGRFERFDFKAGGSYRLVLTYSDASTSTGKSTPNSDIVEARIIELVSGKRVVQAIDFVSDGPASFNTMTMTWQITAAGEGSLVEFRADDVPPSVSVEDHAAGLNSSLENLARFLES
jgi:uncharacterized protein YndB with AHSA1/START domain